MKKILSLALIAVLIFSAEGFAATSRIWYPVAKPAAKKVIIKNEAPTAPKVEQKAAAPVASPASSDPSPSGLSNIGFGFYGGMPTVKYEFNSDINGQAGICYSSNAATSGFSALLSGTYKAYKLGANELRAGATLTLVQSNWTIDIITGIETNISSSVVLGLYVKPLTIGSGSILNLLNGAVIAAHLYI